MVEAKVNHETQFYRIKDGVGVPPSSPPSPITFQRVYEIFNPSDSGNTSDTKGGGGGLGRSPGIT